jgi:hypothetical protein
MSSKTRFIRDAQNRIRDTVVSGYKDDSELVRDWREAVRERQRPTLAIKLPITASCFRRDSR